MREVPNVSELRLPDELADRARAIQDGTVEAAPTRDAATVILVRDGADGADGPSLLVYMLRRVRSMAFAPGAYVFPGGSVDPRDAERSVGWAGPPAGVWADWLHTDESLARNLVCAAVRETFEESGVLLAGPTEDSVVADTRGDDWEADREALIDRSLSFAELLDRRGLVLRSDLLRPWAHWITPVIEKRRYDTRFFVAALPPGQRTRDVSTEADQVAWVHPADASAAARRGEMAMLPPTLVTLLEVADHSSVEAVLAAPRAIEPRLPVARVADDGVFLVLPQELSLTTPTGGETS
jgi:8-oxo-dGTP pyrophosphatase MutT (NUDIX family)